MEPVPIATKSKSEIIELIKNSDSFIVSMIAEAGGIITHCEGVGTDEKKYSKLLDSMNNHIKGKVRIN